MMISLEILNGTELDLVKQIDRSDISTDIVDTVEDIMELTRYGIEHGLPGHTYAIFCEGKIAGIILMGEGIPWSIDPKEVEGIPFYRIMGFLVDRRYRGQGIGAFVLETVIQEICREFGARPILIGCQEDNWDAIRFYQRHDFVSTSARDEDDIFMIRYP